MPPVEQPVDERHLLALLRDVSRSFYLSIQLLPAALRRPVAVGYLLARTSDSIADAPGITAADRLRMLAQFEDDVRGRCPPSPIPAGAGMKEEEARLLGAFPECVGWLERLDRADRADVLTVLTAITHGQRLDVERFGAASAQAPRRLANAEQLDEYTYLVAGSVGEFWTRLGFRHLPGFASLPEAEMLDLGRRYGQGLQLVNVLRDAPEDLVQGRGYLPEPDDARAWHQRALDGLECGLRYALALRSARVRVASALPALIGVRTLALLQDAGTTRAKVPRSEIRALVARLALSLGSRSRIEREFRDNRPR